MAPYRVYDADFGRWLSRDPLDDAELVEGENLYWYVANDPLSLIDPDGRGAQGAAIGAYIGGGAGFVAGGGLGLVAGGSGGSLVCPGVGTIGGASVGTVQGAAVGTAFGTAAGAAIGSMIEDAGAMASEAFSQGGHERNWQGRNPNPIGKPKSKCPVTGKKLKKPKPKPKGAPTPTPEVIPKGKAKRRGDQ